MRRVSRERGWKGVLRKGRQRAKVKMASVDTLGEGGGRVDSCDSMERLM